MTVYLVGNPNVGKSVLFRRLTGVYAAASNYSGTTVEVTTGKLRVGGEIVAVTDLPGTYSLDPISEAEAVTSRFLDQLQKKDIIVNVVDATNLERSLGLTLELIALRKPMIVVLNVWDEAAHTGVKIDVGRLEQLLAVRCLPVVALTGEGVKALVESIPNAQVSRRTSCKRRRWSEVGRVVAAVQVLTHKHHTLAERFGDATLRPLTGAATALAVVGLSLAGVRAIGEGLTALVFDPFFEKIWQPLMLQLSQLLGGGGLLHALLIGNLQDSGIHYGYSFGLLTTGLYVPLAVVLPYVFAFYLLLSVLEDCGYLPRLAVIADRFMHVVGLHGIGIVPMLLGLGCNVPGALAGRVMESPQQRFIAITLMATAIPCMAQVAMIIALASPHGYSALLLILGSLVLIWLTLGRILRAIMKEERMEMILDVPPYRFPYLNGLIQKVFVRLKAFLKEAIPFVLIGVVAINVLHYFSVIEALGRLLSPIVVSLFGLPNETVGEMMVGFLRKDVAVGMLVPLQLSFSQTVVAGVVLAIYFPCVGTLVVMLRELGVAGTLKAAMIMLITVLVVGGLLNGTLRLLGC